MVACVTAPHDSPTIPAISSAWPPGQRKEVWSLENKGLQVRLVSLLSACCAGVE